jgi:purine-binding chemotaxis protein CheW
MAQDQQYVTFGIDREIFAIPVDLVREILDPQPISRLPRAPAYLLGLMDVRGAGLPIVDLRVRFGLPSVEPTNRTRVIILEGSGAGLPAVGLMTDCVFEVTNLGGLELQPPPAIGRKWRSDCVTGIGRRGDDFVIVLNLERLLDSEDLLHVAA